MKKFFVFITALLLLTGCTVKEPSSEVLEKLDRYVEDNGGVLETDGALISLYAHRESEKYQEDFDTVKAFAEACELPVYTAFPPRKMDALTSFLPDDFPVEHSEYIYKLADKTLSDKCEYIDLYSALRGTENTYFKTDHHWTHEGAWIAYREIAERMGVTPIPLEDFEKVELLAEFRGSDFSKKNTVGFYDCIIGVVPDGDFVTEIVNFPYDSEENNVPFDGFYDMTKLKTNEPYAVYLGGNNPYIRVSKVGEERDTVVVVRDSFANALTPYLACHFDVVLIDPRFYPSGISTVAENENATAILILENMGSVTESDIKFKW